MKKNKAKQMLLSLGLMATVTSPLVTVISCGESDGTAPEITVDQTTTLDGETVQGSGTEYTLSLNQGTTVTQEAIEGLFTVEDDMDEDVTLTYTWETGPFEAATTGKCVLTISSEDAAGNFVAYTLTITVSPPEVEGAGSGTGETESSGSGGGETLDTTAPVISNPGTVSGGEQVTGDATTGYALDLTTDTATTVAEVEGLFTATDDTDGVVGVDVAWNKPPADFATANTYVATFTATDVAGNTTVVTLTVTVTEGDTTAPVISVDTINTEIVGSGTSYTLNLETNTTMTAQDVEGAVSATDDGINITSSVVLTWEDSTGNVVDQAAVDFTSADTYVLKANVSDGTNDADEVVITVIVTKHTPGGAGSGTGETESSGSGGGETLDTTAPVISNPGTVSGGEQVTGDATTGYALDLTTDTATTVAEVEGLFTATDDTDGVVGVDVAWNKPPADFATANTYVATFTATDVAGNTTVVTLTVTVAEGGDTTV